MRHYRLADWDGMRAFFASYPCTQLCFSPNNINTVADSVADVVLYAGYQIPPTLSTLALLSLDIPKLKGPGGIPCDVLRKGAPDLIPVLTHLLRLSNSPEKAIAQIRPTLLENNGIHY